MQVRCRRSQFSFFTLINGGVKAPYFLKTNMNKFNAKNFLKEIKKTDELMIKVFWKTAAKVIKEKQNGKRNR